ncbi:MAG: NOP5/NOP56 family protein [archaeon]
MADLQELRRKNIELARIAVRESVSPDLFIINAINNIEELQRLTHMLSKRLREWYSLYLPELDKRVSDNEAFVQFVLKNDRNNLVREFKIKDSMGAELAEKDLHTIIGLAKTIALIIEEEGVLRKYVDERMEELCPNVNLLAGSLIGAKLMRGAGSLKRLAMMRSSTIQLIGAEKALFRHITTGARPPKYGFLMQHPLVQKARREDKGRIARTLADKIFMAAKIDYFKGEFAADRLLKEVEVKLK